MVVGWLLKTCAPLLIYFSFEETVARVDYRPIAPSLQGIDRAYKFGCYCVLSCRINGNGRICW